MPEATKPVSVGFFSLGCAKNLVDSQVMAGVLLSESIVLAPSPETADVVIVNTCAFIEAAREEAGESIDAACALKAAGNCRAVVVTGCYPQRYRHEVQERFPDVDAFVGLDGLEDIGRIVRRVMARVEKPLLAVAASARRTFEPRIPGLALTGGPYAYLKIGEGCNHRCAFCAIPGIRGRRRSRSIKAIVTEAEALLEAGYRELNLISQDTTAYGRDLRDGSDLPTLLTALDGIGGDFWIRLLYGYPTGLTDSLLRAMRELPRVCHYLDIPIQHSHPDVLRTMQRANTMESVRKLGPRARRAMPDVTLRTTCLVGFPGETDAQFEHLLAYVEQTRFDHLGAFVFSPEAGTAAAGLPDRPPREVAEARRDRLMRLQRRLVDEAMAACIGNETDVLLEMPVEAGSNVWVARSRALAPEVDGDIFVEGVPPGSEPGAFAYIRYTGAQDYDRVARFLRMTAQPKQG